jgi:ATP-dependent protease Clp ATPase subunit
MNERISMENLKQKTELEQDLRSDINWKLLQFRTRKIYFMINGNDKEVQKIKEKRKKKRKEKKKQEETNHQEHETSPTIEEPQDH